MKLSITIIIKFQISNLVHIALVFDDNYAMPAGVTISSIIYNNPDLFFCFHLFVDNLSDRNLQKFKMLVSECVLFKIYHLNDKFTINPDTLVLGYLSAISCVRFILPDILYPETDKFLYIDSDILCLKSISPLYNVDITNYVAGVIPDDDVMKNHIKKIYKINSDNYFNSGVLLINTKKWIDSNLTIQCMARINDGRIYEFADQDVLNILLENTTCLLPVKFNTKIHITTSCKEEKEIAPYTVLLHYVTGYKPWYQTFNSQLFQKYFLLSPWHDEKRPLALKRSWLRRYAMYCMKEKKYILSMKFYYLYLFKKLLDCKYYLFKIFNFR
ncbi:glycosyltransferase family 8 protein [Orbaceae bacterium ESL0727]|nr:glycosyltransferase family 8 protein [Orbaceae bacterium ESL0727]